MFASELHEKIQQLGGDVKPTDSDVTKRMKSVAFLYAVVAQTIDKIEGVAEHKSRATSSLRDSYNAMVEAVARK